MYLSCYYNHSDIVDNIFIHLESGVAGLSRKKIITKMTVCISEKQINKIIISLPTIRYDLEKKTNIIRYRKVKFILSRPRNSEIMIFL